MAKRKHADKAEMTDTEYREFQQLQHYDAASLRALALWLNTKKKNAALMKAVSAEMGRNARHMARAVDYFPPFFIDYAILGNDEREKLPEISANEYLMLFEFAKLKHEKATELFVKYRFGTPLYLLRDVVVDAKRNGAMGAPRESLAAQVAGFVQEWQQEYFVKSAGKGLAGEDEGVLAYLANAIDDLAALPPVAREIKRRNGNGAMGAPRESLAALAAEAVSVMRQTREIMNKLGNGLNWEGQDIGPPFIEAMNKLTNQYGEGIADRLAALPPVAREIKRREWEKTHAA